MMEVIGQRIEMLQVVCDEIPFERQINSDKQAGNQDKCARLEMKDKDVVLMLAVPVIVKAMSNKNLLKLGALSWEVGIWNEGVGGGGDDGV